MEKQQSTESLKEAVWRSERGSRVVFIFLYFEGILKALNFISTSGKGSDLCL